MTYLPTYVLECAIHAYQGSIISQLPLPADHIAGITQRGGERSRIAWAMFIVGYQDCLRRDVLVKILASPKSSKLLEMQPDDRMKFEKSMDKFIAYCNDAMQAADVVNCIYFSSAAYSPLRALFNTARSEVDKVTASAEEASEAKTFFIQERESVEAAHKMLDEIVAEFESKATAALAAVRHNAEIKELDTLWNSKRVAHLVNYRIGIGAMALLVLIIIAVYAVIYHQYSQLIHDIVKNNAIAAGVIVSIPAVFIFTLLRAAAKFTNANLTLMDDARQRQALSATLKNILAEPNLDLSKEMKGFVLEALFRVAPGQPVDEGIHPLLDLLRPKDDKAS